MTYRFLVFGAGAIGTYLGGSLAVQGHEVVFLERQRDISDLKKRGLQLKIEDNIFHVDTPLCFGSIKHAARQKFDLGILALKTYHLGDILADINLHKEHLPPILCLQNGVYGEGALSEILGSDQVIPGTITTAVEKNQKGNVVIQKVRGMGLAGDHPGNQLIVSLFNQAGLKCTHYNNPDDMKWSKLILNLLGNASSAILNMPPADIYTHPGLYKLELNQIKEALRVMRLMQIKAVNLPGIPVKALVWGVNYLPWQIFQPILIKMVGGGRAGKMPSMHIDLYNKRGKSEVAQLNGAVVRKGKELGIPTPVNLTLTTVLEDLVNGRLPLEKYANQPDKLLNLVDEIARLGLKSIT